MPPRKTMRRAHYATTTDPRVIQSRKALKQALLELIQKKPFKAITIREITDRAGVGYNTFFRHQSGKDELLKDIAAGEIERLIELSMAALDKTNTRQAARAVCEYVAQHRVLWSALLAAGAVETLRDEFIRLSWIQTEKTPLKVDPAHAEAGILLVASGTIELLAWWLREPGRLSLDELTDIYERLVISPVINTDPK